MDSSDQRSYDSGLASPAEFISTIFDLVVPGYLELRLFAEGPDTRGKPPVARHWLGIDDTLEANLDAALKEAREKNAAVYFGVLPRRAKGGGKAEDVLPGRDVWADLDFKDYPGGEAEARARLNSFPIPPTIIVRSGHGLHAYWLLNEVCDVPRLCKLAKMLAEVLGGDSVHDAPRVMRLPGSCNRKDPADPIPVVIEAFTPSLRVDANDLEEACAILFSDHEEPEPPKAERTGGVPESVAALMASSPKLRDLFMGVGKPPVDHTGKQLDTSGSGYDYSFLLELARKNIRDPRVLGEALVCRPDGHARHKGTKYVARTVAAVLDALAPKAADVVDRLGIQRVRIYGSVPPEYELDIGAKVVRLTGEELATPTKFAMRVMEATHRMPDVPSKRSDWAPWVNGLLAKGEHVEMPPEASDELALHEAVETAIAELPVSDDVAELQHGKALALDDGQRGFRSATLLKGLLEDFPSLTRARLCRVLNALGFVSSTSRVQNKVIRVWSRKEAK